MSSVLLHQAMQALAICLTLGAFAAALGALAVRSMIAMCVRFSAAAALAAAAALTLGYGAAALTLALFGAALAPVVLMAGVLLSAPAAKKGRFPWTGIVAGVLVLGAIVWAAPELLTLSPLQRVTVPISGLWLAVLAFVAAAACTALLGYGERGILEPRRDRFE